MEEDLPLEGRGDKGDSGGAGDRVLTVCAQLSSSQPLGRRLFVENHRVQDCVGGDSGDSPGRGVGGRC